MSNVINLFEKKSEMMTPEQRLKLYCLQEIMGTEHMVKILKEISIDEAFSFIAEQAVAHGSMTIDKRLSGELPEE